MDFSLEQWINGPASAHAVWDGVMTAVATWAELVAVVGVVLWFLIGVVRRIEMDRVGAIRAVLASALALAVNQVISHLWERPRPWVSHPGSVHLLVAHSTDASFPSDHAAAAFAISIVLLTVHRRAGILALLASALLAYARIYVGLHYPGDVAAGAAIGIAAGVVIVTWLAPLGSLVSALSDRLLRGTRVLSADG